MTDFYFTHKRDVGYVQFLLLIDVMCCVVSHRAELTFDFRICSGQLALDILELPRYMGFGYQNAACNAVNNVIDYFIVELGNR